MPRPRSNRGRYAKLAANKVAKQTFREDVDTNKPYAISYLSKFAGAQLDKMEAEGVIKREEGRAMRFPGGEDADDTSGVGEQNDTSP